LCQTNSIYLEIRKFFKLVGLGSTTTCTTAKHEGYRMVSKTKQFPGPHLATRRGKFLSRFSVYSE
jgi:hypothetical protein